MYDRYNKTVIITGSAIVILVLAGLIAYHLMNRGASVTAPLLPTATATIGGQEFDLEVATTPAEQGRGLSGRANLGLRDGMLFIFGAPGIQTFWMVDMKFPIDLIWINGDKIVGFEEDMLPPAALGLNATDTTDLPIYMSPGLADRVIEINSGLVVKLGLKAGDTIPINLGSL